VIHIKKIRIRNSVLLVLSLIIGIVVSYIVTRLDSSSGPTYYLKKDNIKEYSISLIMAGDALIHGAVYSDAYSNNQYDFTKMLDLIKPIVKNYDLAFYNQETIIGGKNLGLSSYPRFNSPEEIGDAMIDAGFNLVSLANNHTLDRGEQAVINSLNYWKDKNVMTAGSYSSNDEKQRVDIRTKNNISYTLLSYTTLTNGLKPPIGKDYYIDIYNKEKAKNDVLRLRDKVDVLIVSMHWGNEYTHTPNKEQEEIAEYLSSLGVDIIIGHHPHVIQPIKTINNTLVIYSLGNFISAQIGTPRLIGMLASVNINKKVKDDTIQISYEDITAELIYTYSDKNRKNFKVIPFRNITEDLLPNYRTHYATYSSIITNYDDTVMVTKID